MTRHVVVPYPRSNSSVRTRALHWVERATAAGRVEPGGVVMHGPGFASSPVEPGTPVLLLRNAGRLSRGRREQQLLHRAAPGVYDLDDGLPWDDGTLPDLGRWWKRPFPRSLIARRAASSADRVIAGNDVIAEWAAQHCDDVVIVPTCVEPGEYEVRSTWEIGGGVPVIGWIGSPATEHYLRDISGPLREVHDRLGARLEIVSGAGPIPSGLESFATKVTWTPESTRAISRWDVGIMPLRDGVYERAKCGYKLLQYAASGVPAVGSPVGVNAQLLREMEGLAATTDDEWVDALVTILTEPAEHRRRRALSGIALAERYSYAHWQDRWLSAVGW